MLGTLAMDEKIEWISSGKAARILEVSTQAVRDFVKAGKLTKVMDLGSEDLPRYYFDKTEVEALARERKTR